VDTALEWLFLAIGALAVIGFIWASVRSSRNYEESMSPPDDLKRADESWDRTGGAPPGGSIWPDNR